MYTVTRVKDLYTFVACCSGVDGVRTECMCWNVVTNINWRFNSIVIISATKQIGGNAKKRNNDSFIYANHYPTTFTLSLSCIYYFRMLKNDNRVTVLWVLRTFNTHIPSSFLLFLPLPEKVSTKHRVLCS